MVTLEKKRNLKFFIFGIFIIMFLSLVSAGWFGNLFDGKNEITGKVTANGELFIENPQDLAGNGILSSPDSGGYDLTYTYAEGYCKIVQGCTGFKDAVIVDDHEKACRCASSWGCNGESCVNDVATSSTWNRIGSVICTGCSVETQETEKIKLTLYDLENDSGIDEDEIIFRDSSGKEYYPTILQEGKAVLSLQGKEFEVFYHDINEIYGDEYVEIGNQFASESLGYPLKLYSLENDTGTDYDEVEFEDSLGEVYLTSIYQDGKAYLNLQGKEFEISYFGDNHKEIAIIGNHQIKEDEIHVFSVRKEDTNYIGLEVEKSQTPIFSCTDSDGGKKIYSKGKMICSSMGNAPLEDVCKTSMDQNSLDVLESPYLLEYSCESEAEACRKEIEKCPTGTTCEDGACVENLLCKDISDEIKSIQNSQGDIILKEYEKVMVRDYVLVGSSLLELTNCDNDTGTDDDEFIFENVFSGETYEASITGTENQATLNIEGKEYQIFYGGGTSDNNCYVKIDAYPYGVYDLDYTSCFATTLTTTQEQIKNQSSEQTDNNEIPSAEEEFGEKICEDGCLLENKCVPICYRYKDKYCSISGEFVPQMNNGESCYNNCECESNACVNGECLSTNFIQRVINWFRNLFGSRE